MKKYDVMVIGSGFAGMAAAIIPTGSEIVSSHAIAVDGLARLTGASGGYRPYAVTVQYAWVPNNVILRDGAAAGLELLNNRKTI